MQNAGGKSPGGGAGRQGPAVDDETFSIELIAYLASEVHEGEGAQCAPDQRHCDPS